MKPGPQQQQNSSSSNNKQRSRGRGNGGGGGGGGGGASSSSSSSGGSRRPPMRANQTFDSNGPEIRIRGNAHQVLEKYLALARDASSQGDRIAAENFYQHAEHYFRTINSQNQNMGRPRATMTSTPADDQMGEGEYDESTGESSHGGGGGDDEPGNDQAEVVNA